MRPDIDIKTVSLITEQPVQDKILAFLAIASGPLGQWRAQFKRHAVNAGI